MNFCLMLPSQRRLISANGVNERLRCPAALIHRTRLELVQQTVGLKMLTSRGACRCRTVSLSSPRPADPAQRTTGEETKFPSLSVCKAASFPGQRTEQAAINYKEILSSCGRFATTRVSKANRYGVFGSLVPCTAAIPNPGPQILLQQIREE